MGQDLGYVKSVPVPRAPAHTPRKLEAGVSKHLKDVTPAGFPEEREGAGGEEEGDRAGVDPILVPVGFHSASREGSHTFLGGHLGLLPAAPNPSHSPAPLAGDQALEQALLSRHRHDVTWYKRQPGSEVPSRDRGRPRRPSAWPIGTRGRGHAAQSWSSSLHFLWDCRQTVSPL